MNASCRGRALGLLLLSLTTAGSVRAQGPTVTDSTVGYIDGAIPVSMLRLRFDDAQNIHAYTRGEFINAHSPSPGLPLEESRLDYAELSAYAEFAIYDRLSVFIEQPLRYLDAEINRDHFGLTDLNAGFKWAFLWTDARVATFQLRTYVPSGDASRGLGTAHTTLEPALLFYQRLGAGLNFESEARATLPIGGTSEIVSDVIRYGVGMEYDLYKQASLSVCPVVEFVGWTFLNGKEDLIVPGQVEETTRNAAGQTIVNAKLGVRFKIPQMGDVYFGYGRALTGSTLYKDIYRLEWRFYY